MADETIGTGQPTSPPPPEQAPAPVVPPVIPPVPTTPPPASAPVPVTDLSREAVRLARFIDRLPPGERYIVVLEKPVNRGEKLQFEISRSEVVREMGQ